MVLNIVYLVDCSGSMGNKKGVYGLPDSKLDYVKKCLTEILDDERVVGNENRAVIVAFRQRPFNEADVEVLVPLNMFCSDYSLAIEKLNAMGAEGGTPIGAAIKAGLNILSDESANEKGIMLITDASGSIGDDPRLSVFHALRMNIRIDVVGLGKNVDVKTLKHISEKTGGNFISVIEVGEVMNSLIWQRTAKALPKDISDMLDSRELFNFEMRQNEDAHIKGDKGDYEYVTKKSDLKAKMWNLMREMRQKEKQFGDELEPMLAGKKSIMKELANLHQEMIEQAIDKKAYLKMASPMEDRIANLNQEMAVRMEALREFKEFVIEEYQPE